MISYISSKNYYFISVRSYASKHHLKGEWQDREKSRIAMCNSAKLYLEFYDSFVKTFSGDTVENIRNLYMFNYREVSEEIIHELTGVNICCAEGTYIYCIPKTDIGYKIYDWILKNCLCKHKILKKTRGTYMDRGVQRTERERFSKK